MFLSFLARKALCVNSLMYGQLAVRAAKQANFVINKFIESDAISFWIHL